MIVTSKRLKDLGACPEGVRKFRKRFGGRAKVTRERLLTFRTHTNWIAKNLFPEHKKAYLKAEATHWKACIKVTHWEAYFNANASSLADVLGLP